MLNLPMSAVSHFFLWVHLRSRILPMTQVWKGTKTASLPRCKWWFSDFFSNLPITGKACRGGTSTRGTKLDEKHPEGLWLFQILWSCIKGGKKRLQIQFHFLQTSFNFIFFEDVLWFNNIIMTPSLTKTSSPEALFFQKALRILDPSKAFSYFEDQNTILRVVRFDNPSIGGSNDPLGWGKTNRDSSPHCSSQVGMPGRTPGWRRTCSPRASTYLWRRNWRWMMAAIRR